MSDYLYRIYLPPDDESSDILLRLPNDARIALRTMLGRISRNELTSKGMTDDQCKMISNLLSSLD